MSHSMTPPPKTGAAQEQPHEGTTEKSLPAVANQPQEPGLKEESSTGIPFLRRLVYDAIVAHINRPMAMKPLPLTPGPAVSALSLDIAEAIGANSPAPCHTERGVFIPGCWGGTTRGRAGCYCQRPKCTHTAAPPSTKARR